MSLGFQEGDEFVLVMKARRQATPDVLDALQGGVGAAFPSRKELQGEDKTVRREPLAAITLRQAAERLRDLPLPGEGFADDLEAIQEAQPPSCWGRAVALLIDSSIFSTLERRRIPLGRLPGVGLDQAVGPAIITASGLLQGVHRAESAERRLRRSALWKAC